MLVDGVVGALPKVLQAYMGEVALPTNPTQGKKTWPLRVLAQRVGIIAKYGYLAHINIWHSQRATQTCHYG